MSFDRFSEALAREFLHSVIVVDDQAAFPDPAATDVEYEDLLPPDEAAIVGGEFASELTTTVPPAPRAPDGDGEPHSLDAKAVVDGFAEEGIVCSVIRPSDHEMDQIVDRVCRVAGRADIVVLDWVLHGDESGERTLQIIEQLAEAPIRHRRARLIVVYSGQRSPQDVCAQIADRLHPTEGSGESVLRIDEYTLLRGPVRIAVYSKRYARTIDVSRRVRETELPTRLIKEFARMTDGLVPNVVLEALTQVRNNTYRLLSTFDRRLDAPFLTHRAMLEHPDDARVFLRSLIAAEIDSLLEEYDVGDRSANIEVVQAWLDNEAERRVGDQPTNGSFVWVSGGTPVEFSAADMKLLLSAGVNGVREDQLSGIQRGKLGALRKDGYRTLTAALARAEEDPTESNREFAALSALRTRYRHEEMKPRLSLGTILRSVPSVGPSTERYWLCLQAPCDSVRIKGRRRFPLMPFKVVGTGDRFDLVIRSPDGGYVQLKFVDRPFEVEHVEFEAPSPEEVVLASKVDERLLFTTTDDEHFEWVAELRFEHSQRTASEHAARSSRIGLNEFEWLRRSGL